MNKENVTCRGSYALGTACGSCSRCKEEQKKHGGSDSADGFAAEVLRRHLEEKPYLGVTTKAAMKRAIESLDGTQARMDRLEKHLLIDVLAQAAKGQGIDPEMCQTIEDIVKKSGYTGFTKEDVQALYDCGGPAIDPPLPVPPDTALKMKNIQLINLLGDIIAQATNDPAKLTSFNSPVLQLAVMEVYEHNNQDAPVDDRSRQIFQQMALVAYNG